MFDPLPLHVHVCYPPKQRILLFCVKTAVDVSAAVTPDNQVLLQCGS